MLERVLAARGVIIPDPDTCRNFSSRNRFVTLRSDQEEHRNLKKDRTAQGTQAQQLCNST